jgi:hypothetical protein
MLDLIAQHKPIDQMSIDELNIALGDPAWRLSHLYKIKTKEPNPVGKDEDDEEEEDDSAGVVVVFKPNRAQSDLLANLHFKNLILKARQLGFTTLIQVMFLDFAFYQPNINLGVLAHTDDAAKKIFKKIKFAYDNLPLILRKAMPLTNCSVREMTLANGSTISVGTSMRGDTIHYLHVSEYGKICAKFPDRAEEIITGTFPAVPDTGMIFIESTAEGREGDFFQKATRAEALHLSGKVLSKQQFRFHFYPWHDELTYQMDPAGVIMTNRDHEYFDTLEQEVGKPITLEQRAWYVSTRDEKFSGADERMWQEYPSTPKEAFQQSTEGKYYTKQITLARKQKRITTVPYHPGLPVNTFWDIGHGDGTAIWFHQRVGQRDNFIKFIEGWGESYSYFVAEMQKLGWIWGQHFLPHDGKHVRQGMNENLSPDQMLSQLGLRSIEIVPRVPEIQQGIQKVRDVFSNCWFDEVECKEGIIHLEEYGKQWSDRTKTWSSQPLHDLHSEGADAFRQFAQGYEDRSNYQTVQHARSKSRRNWRTV